MAGSNPFDQFDIVSPQTVTIGTRDPAKVRAEERAQATADRGAAAAERQAATAAAAQSDKVKDYILKLSQDYNSDPTVKAYRTAIQQFAQAINTGVGPQADLALTYAFAKAMDPESVVRESEQGMVEGSQARLDALAEKIKKEFGYSEAGGFTPEARDALRKQISNSVAQRVKVYDARRGYIEQQARAIGVDPRVILGEHDAAPFVPAIRDWVERANGQDLQGQQAEPELARAETDAANAPAPLAPADEEEGLTGTVSYEGPNTYRGSYTGQTVSGVNEGIAGILGAPVDLTAFGMNLVPKALNAVASTDIPEITDPVGGSDWFRDKMADWAIYGPSADQGKQFARRVGESVGASAVPAGLMTKPAMMLASLASGAGGGVGAATAQHVFPKNPLAEFLGEVAGGGLTVAGAAKAGQRAAQREIEAAIPTTAQLREKASQLYDKAETSGAIADPALTQQLADDFRTTLVREGQLGPAGRISDADTNTTKAYNLIKQYAGQPMRPTEMNTVRTVIADGRKSTEPSDQRLAKVLTEQFDDWARPLAPEFDEARDVASRYLQAEDLEEARELAKANESGFSQSGLENSLRTQYRGLDRSTIRGKDWFKPETLQTIQNVSRGTPASNFARGVGKMAPTGTVSAATSVGVPAALGMQATGSPMGLGLGLATGGLGLAGRAAATRMTDRAAQLAELTARNGAPIPQAPALTPEVKRMVELLAAVQSIQYLPQN